MLALRWLFIAASLTCVIVAAWTENWEARLTAGDVSWTLGIDQRAPVWAPPVPPAYEKFREAFADWAEDPESRRFPDADDPDLSIRTVLQLEYLATDLLLLLWPAAVVSGFLYLLLLGGRRDLILHCALATGAGMTLGALVCVGLWIAWGGWGVPYQALLGGAGWLGGLLVGFASWTPEPGRVETV